MPETSTPTSDRLRTQAQAEAQLQITRQTLHNWRKAGVIDAVRLGRNVRYRQSDLDALVENGTGWSRDSDRDWVNDPLVPVTAFKPGNDATARKKEQDRSAK